MEEKKFEKLINDLKKLRKVEAPDNFEFKLQTKLQNSSIEEPSSTKKTYKLVPAFAFASIIVLLFILYSPFSDEYEDPFEIQPRIREDIIAYSDNENQAPLSEILNDSFKENDSNLQRRLNDMQSNPKEELNKLNSSSAIAQPQIIISKDDLNFTRSVISDEEKLQVQLLKQKLMNIKN